MDMLTSLVNPFCYNTEQNCSPQFIEPDADNCTCLSDQELIERANYYGYKYVAPGIFAIGLAGNTANIIILRNQKKFKGRLYIYLRALAITDIICLCFAISGIIHQMSRPFTFDESHMGEPVQVICHYLYSSYYPSPFCYHLFNQWMILALHGLNIAGIRELFDRILQSSFWKSYHQWVICYICIYHRLYDYWQVILKLLYGDPNQND